MGRPGFAAIIALAALGTAAWAATTPPAPGGAARDPGFGPAPGSAAKSAMGPSWLVGAPTYRPEREPGGRWGGPEGELSGRRDGPAAPRPSGTGTPRVPANLHVTQDLAPDPVIIGGEAVYVMTVTNAGVTDAGGVIATAVLDRHLTPGRLPDACSLTGRTVTCGTALPAGGSVAFELPVGTDPALQDGTSLVNRAHVTAPDALAGEDELTTRARAVAEVEVRQEGTPQEVGHGERIPYRLTVTNHGPSRAANVSLHNPADGDRATIAERPAECPASGSASTCPLGPLAPGESRTYAFSLTPHVAGPLTICASVTTGGGEENTEDNHACADTVVAAAEPAQESIEEPEETPEPAPSASPDKERKSTGHEPDEPRRERDPEPPAAAGDVPPPAHHSSETLPLTGASMWMLGLGVAVLLAIGLLVRFFSHQDRRTP
ncbi:CARDB domain-containing protein [Nonomuraea sp. NPDC049504]|uniref:CARDB domain-containing protein n=1 Tax=Nonomuraea sp. NPDC049504 TaxID=3154729 RepID=UPI00344A5FD1